MTIHSAKGLEFPYVFIVGMEENLFPSQLSTNTREDLEEERRLFYVALTRAEKKVILTYSSSRYRWGNLIFNEPSRFLEELQEDLIEYKNIHQQKSKISSIDTKASINVALKKKKLKPLHNNTKGNLNFNYSDTSELAIGNSVEHAKFGVGKVLHIEGGPGNKKAVVFFEGVGQKQLLLKYAKLKILA